MAVSLRKVTDPRPSTPFGDDVAHFLFNVPVPASELPVITDERPANYSDGYGGIYSKGE